MNKKTLILLSGTPASGKDSITNEMIKTNSKFTHFKKHKISTGGKLDNTYNLVSKSEFDQMAESNKFLQYHYRYDRGYGVSKAELELNWNNGFIPIIHVGKYENIHFFLNDDNIRIISVLIMTSKDETNRRLILRHNNDNSEIKARMNAYIEERKELSELISKGDRLHFDFIIENTFVSASKVGKLISNIALNF